MEGGGGVVCNINTLGPVHNQWWRVLFNETNTPAVKLVQHLGHQGLTKAEHPYWLQAGYIN